MAHDSVKALTFDMYCTTHNTHSVKPTLKEKVDLPDQVLDDFLRTWRDMKIDFSRKLTLCDETTGEERENYVTWWTLMERAFDYAAEFYGVDISDTDREEVVNAYDHLEPYEPSWESFERMQEAGYDLYILSNGNYDMLRRLAENTGQMEHLDGLISGEDVRVFKPHPDIYLNALNHLDYDIDEIMMTASHAWDCSGGANVGMQTAFINRRGMPKETFTDPNPEFDIEVDSFEELADELC